MLTAPPCWRDLSVGGKQKLGPAQWAGLPVSLTWNISVRELWSEQEKSMCMGSVAGILVLYMCISQHQCAALPGNQHLGGKYKVELVRESLSLKPLVFTTFKDTKALAHNSEFNKEIQVSVLGDCLDHRHGYPDQFWSRRAIFHTNSAHNLLLSNVSSRDINIYSFPFRRNVRSSRIVNISVYLRCEYFFDI